MQVVLALKFRLSKKFNIQWPWKLLANIFGAFDSNNASWFTLLTSR